MGRHLRTHPTPALAALRSGGAARSAAPTARLAIAIEGNAPPTEVRIFVAGWNESENGGFLFDAESAKSVMSAYAAHSVDRMFDLEHLSLDADSPNYDPDARGWAKLELRDDGSLWAVAITWTDDGTRRLTSKTQRYISPAFTFDVETKRVKKLVNIAITALPATHGTPELMAASVARDLRKLSVGVSFDAIQAAITTALKAHFPNLDPDKYVGPWVVEVFDTTCIYEVEGCLYEVAYTFDGMAATLAPAGVGHPPGVEVKRTYAPVAPPPVVPAAPMAANRTRVAKLAAGGGQMDPKLIAEALDALIAGDMAKCMEILKGIVTSAAGGETAPAEDPAAMAAADEKQAEVMAATSLLMRLSGKPTIGESVREAEAWHTSHLKLEAETAKLSAERAILEMGQRRAALTHLVVAGARKPFEVWAPDATTGLPDGKTPYEEYASMSLARLNALVTAHPLANKPGAPKPPAGSGPTAAQFNVPGHGLISLNANDLAVCAEMKCEPEKYARLNAHNIAARAAV